MAAPSSGERRSITRLLVANRGEIAVRIARTARRMGITTVGVHSEVDRDALHVDSMDLAVPLGGSSPAESYLDAAAVLDAARSTGCDAVHPGYGFLAENEAFARAVLDAGLVWVGPTPEQIALLGDKVAAKRAAVDAGVPTSAAIEVAPGAVPEGVPMPALVKAAAGGGGRGMRVVRDRSELSSALEAASREAESAFGDGTVFVEPYLEHGRHVEVQIFGDAHGDVVHLGERECSIQRRNQKVVEESPSPGIDAATRAALCDGALALARHVGYLGAGTVEFLVGRDGTINFLEVNTRLQVEHPVTEAVTGLDLVELQLRVAAGEPLPLTQEQVRCEGHAIEVRLVAEDPAAGWLPSTGRIDRFEVPDTVRCDTGVRDGSFVAADYDSLLAKVVAHAEDRAGAARALGAALRRSVVVGPRTNLASLAALVAEADFLAGDTTTGYLDAHPDVVAATGPGGEDELVLLVAATLDDEAGARAADRRWGFAPSGWRNLRVQGQRSRWLDEHDREHLVELQVLDHDDRGAVVAEVRLGPWPEPGEDGTLPSDERTVWRVRSARASEASGAVRIRVTGEGTARTELVRVEALGDRLATSGHAGARVWTRAPRFVDHDASAAAGGPVAPLPGTVIAVHVAPGDVVADGDLLVVMEAMKMEHSITATSAGTVGEVRVAVGDRVDAGDVLVLVDQGG
jgi:propionyl-CoA carboxylase alpha chain